MSCSKSNAAHQRLNPTPHNTLKAHDIQQKIERGAGSAIFLDDKEGGPDQPAMVGRTDASKLFGDKPEFVEFF